MPNTPSLDSSIANEVAVLIREARRMRDEAKFLQDDELRHTLLSAARKIESLAQLVQSGQF
jgi:hypothetical protein